MDKLNLRINLKLGLFRIYGRIFENTLFFDDDDCATTITKEASSNSDHR